MVLSNANTETLLRIKRLQLAESYSGPSLTESNAVCSYTATNLCNVKCGHNMLCIICMYCATWEAAVLHKGAIAGKTGNHFLWPLQISIATLDNNVARMQS